MEEIPYNLRQELEEMNAGIDKALKEFADIKRRGLIKELFNIVHDDSTNDLIEQWIDMTVILGIKNHHITLRNPLNLDDQAMIVDGQNGIRDLILKGFLYGLYWKTKQLENSNLEKMWNVEESND